MFSSIIPATRACARGGGRRRRHQSRARALIGLVAPAVLTLGVVSPWREAGGQSNPSRDRTDVVTPARERGTQDLDSLVARALEASPRISAAAARVDAARHRIGPAAAWADPMLMAGIQNLPITDPGFADGMTMKMVGVAQTIPYPGKRTLNARAAEYEAAAARAEFDGVRLEVSEAVERAYYDLAYLDQALDVVARSQQFLVDFIKVTEARYGVGTGGQEEVLRVRVEVARLGEEAVALAEQRRSTLARLNAVLDRPSETPVIEPAVPGRIARAAVAGSAAAVRFESATIGSRAADSPLPPLETLQAAAIRQNPLLRAQKAMISAQAARAELARKEHLPDVDVSLSYGQRDGARDMVSATVSIPIPLHRARKQGELAAEARSSLAALEAERHERVNALRAEVARLHAELERDRAQLALYVKAVLPQGRAALSSATAGYQVGRTDFLSLLDAQATLFNYETSYFRVLSDFASSLAELERVVGEEILQ